MSGMSLYALTGMYYELAARAETDDLTAEEVAVMEQELTVMIQQKAAGIIWYYRNLDAAANAVDNEIERLSNMKKSIIKERDKHKDRVKAVMDMHGIVEITTEGGKLKIAKNPVSVDIIDFESVPEEYKKTTISVTADKKAISDHFKATGEIIPGTMMKTDNTRLDIK